MTMTTTFLVFDKNGLFLPLARRLAEDGDRVLYQTPADSRDRVNEDVIGEGFPDLEWCEDLWLIKKEVDCFVFPDVRHLGIQQELRSQGYPVWGAGSAMRLELDREFFLRKLKELNLDVPEYEVKLGLTELQDHLKDKEDIYIKVSKWRGSWETFHWRSWKEDAHRSDIWGVRFGGLKELIRFICFPAIKTNLEIGADTYCIDGRWPNTMLHGIECKDEAYFSAVTKRDEMPEELLPIMEAFSPFLRDGQYRCQWSMEVRVSDKGNFFIDATTRGGLPSTASFLMAKNVPEIILSGAHGELVEPHYGFKFSAECMVKIKGEHGAWETIVLPDELKQNMKLSDCCMVEGQAWFPPDEGHSDEIGWLVATGDTPTEVAEEMNRLADLLPDGADACVESLASVIREIESEQEQGIKFTDSQLPDPSVVLEQ